MALTKLTCFVLSLSWNERRIDGTGGPASRSVMPTTGVEIHLGTCDCVVKGVEGADLHGGSAHCLLSHALELAPEPRPVAIHLYPEDQGGLQGSGRCFLSLQGKPLSKTTRCLLSLGWVLVTWWQRGAEESPLPRPPTYAYTHTHTHTRFYNHSRFGILEEWRKRRTTLETWKFVSRA